jgi:hypothetical protein
MVATKCGNVGASRNRVKVPEAFYEMNSVQFENCEAAGSFSDDDPVFELRRDVTYKRRFLGVGGIHSRVSIVTNSNFLAL